MDELCRLPCLTRTTLGSNSVVFGSTAATFSSSETTSGGAVKTKLILVVPELMSSNTLDNLAACTLDILAASTFWLFKYEKAANIEPKTIKPKTTPWPVIVHSRGWKKRDQRGEDSRQFQRSTGCDR